MYSPDGASIFTASKDKTVRSWDANTGTERFRLGPHAGPVQLLRISPDGKLLAISGGSNTVFFWDTKTGARLCEWEDPARTRAEDLDFSPNDDLVAIAVLTGVYLVDPYTGLPIELITANAHDVRSLQFSKDGLRLVTGNIDHLVVETSIP